MSDASRSNAANSRLIALIVGACLLALAAASIELKSGYYRVRPFIPDGDTYFHGMLTNYIVDNHRTTTSVPYEFPPTPHGYSFNFHILSAQIHWLTGASVISIMRWFGPIMSAAIVFAVYAAAKRFLRSTIGALFAASLTLFIPLLSARLSNTYPENILVFFIPVLLWLLLDANENKNRYPLYLAGIMAVSAIGFHFSSYLLVPIFLAGMLFYFVGRRWRYRNIGYMAILTVGLVLAVSAVYSNWWVFGFLKSFFQTYSGPALQPASVLSTYAQPPPDSGQWSQHLGYLPMLLGAVGTVAFVFSRRIPWRSKAILLSAAATILLPLEILPFLKVFSYTPFRAFVYFAIPMAIAAGATLTWVARRGPRFLTAAVIALAFVFFAPSYHLPAKPGPGDQQLTPGEYNGGFRWLMGHTSSASIVVTAPANGRQVAFFTKEAVAYDTAQPVFDAKTTSDALAAIKQLGDYPIVYIYISKYKLGPVYNFGEIREYAFVRSDLTKFDDRRYFRRAFEDSDSLIYQRL